MTNASNEEFGGRFLRTVGWRFARQRASGIFYLPWRLADLARPVTPAEQESSTSIELNSRPEADKPAANPVPRPAKKRPSRHCIELYDFSALVDMQEREEASRSAIGNKRRAECLRRLDVRGPTRQAGFSIKASLGLARLRSEMPHFAAPIEHVELALVTARHAKRAVRISPILLLGPAGVGKSHFAEGLAATLGLPVFRQQMDASSINSTLAGADAAWSNANAGAVFSALAESEQANPVFLLDELDKACGRHHYDPLAPLHGLLEPVSAKRFTDAFVQLPIDASHIIWVATANNPEALPVTLRSRFREFEIPVPDQEVMATVVDGVFRSVLHGFALHHKIKQLSPKARACLVKLTPRAARLRLQQAVGKALLAGRSQIELADVSEPVTVMPKRFGFLAHEAQISRNNAADDVSSGSLMT